jgi:hypothetical protein
MKNSIKYGCYNLLAVVLASCGSNVSNQPNKTTNETDRIHIVGYKKVGGYRVFIIEVDGKEYLTRASGSFIKLSK